MIKIYQMPKNFITTSYQVYKKRTKSSYNLLDSIEDKNIFRIYPERLFCNNLIKDRCATHDDKSIFYDDDDHPSHSASEMINDLIIKELENIELIHK
jgi:hypothetical protein